MNQQAEISVNDTTTGAGCRPKEVTGRMVLICLVALGYSNLIPVQAAQ